MMQKTPNSQGIGFWKGYKVIIFLADSSTRALQLAWASSIAVFIISFLFALQSSPFPYADEWQYANMAGSPSPSEIWTWAWTPHVDHLIPIQKLIQLGLLNASGFDFRILTMFNLVLALFAVFFILKTFLNLRSHLKIADSLVPFILVSPSWNYLSWGFQFQFISTIFLTSLAICLATNSPLPQQSVRVFGRVTLTLFFLSLTGVNGSIASVILTLALVTNLISTRVSSKEFWPKLAGLIGFSFLPNLFLWLTWNPSSSSGQSQALLDVAGKMFFLFGSSFNIAGLPERWPVSVIVLAALLVALAHFAKKLNWSEPNTPAGLVASGLLVSLVLLIAIAIGRGGNYDEWSNVISMHYGLLTVLIPIYSWAIISLSRQSYLRASVAVILLSTSAFGYLVNSAWKTSVQIGQNTLISSARSDMKYGLESKLLALKHAKLLSWKDDYENIHSIEIGLDSLRAENLPLYSLSDNK